MLQSLFFKNYALYIIAGWLLLALQFGSTPGYAQTYTSAVRVPATPTAPGYARGRRIVHDAQGNTYVVGPLAALLSVGTTTLNPAQGSDMFVAKLSAAGTWQWAVQAVQSSNIGTVTTTDIALDGQGRLFITGIFNAATLRFGTQVLTNNSSLGGGSSVFVAMLDTNGIWQWAAQTSSGQAQTSVGIAASANGTVTITGIYSLPGITFGGIMLPVAASTNDIFVAQLNSATGTWNWAVRGGGAPTPNGVYVTDIALDRQGNAYVCGQFTGRIPLGAVSIQSTNLLTPDVFVAKLTPAGMWAGATSAGGIYQDISTAIALDAEDGVYLTGLFESGTAAFGPYTLTNVNSTGGDSDIFVAKLNATLQWQWARQAGGATRDEADELSVDRNANVYIVGKFFSTTCSLGPTNLTNAHPNGFTTDIFVAKLDGDGQWQWAVRAGGFDDDVPGGVSASDQGQVYVTGTYRSQTANFGAVTLTTPAYFDSGFVAQLASPTVQIAGDTLLCTGSQLTLSASSLGTATAYRWNTGATTATITVTQAGIYRVTATFADGQHSSAWHVVGVSAAAAAPRIVGDTVLCPGSGATLTAIAPAARSYQWNTGATTANLPITQPGLYTLIVTYAGGCTQTTQVHVRALNVQLTGGAQLCPGGSISLAAVAIGATTYQWNTGATTPTLTVTQPGTYWVQATFPGGCTLRASQAVSLPQALIQGDSLLCSGQQVHLTAANPSATSYRWNTGATTPAITVSQAGVYSVQVGFSAGCTSVAQVQVRVVPTLADLTLGADTTACEEAAIVLRVPQAVLGQVGLTYRWNTGATTAALAVQQSGTYSLQLQSACATRTLTRTVSFSPCLSIPNVITPNGDSFNERFIVQGLRPTVPWTLELYNRWGHLVYRSAAYQNDWGLGAAPGLYYYLLRLPGSALNYKGWVEVIL